MYNTEEIIVNYPQELQAMRNGLELLGGKWKLILLRHLFVHAYQRNNFKKILRAIEGLSAKMLAKELKDLEAQGMITRTITSTRPLAIEYAITDYGKTALPIAETLLQWGIQHALKTK